MSDHAPRGTRLLAVVGRTPRVHNLTGRAFLLPVGGRRLGGPVRVQPARAYFVMPVI